MNISRNVVFFTINLENQGEDSYLFQKNNWEMKFISLGGGGGSLGQHFFWGGGGGMPPLPPRPPLESPLSTRHI